MVENVDLKVVEGINSVEEILDKAENALKEDDDLLLALDMIRACDDMIVNDEISYNKKPDDDKTDYENFLENRFVKLMKFDEDLLFKSQDAFKKVFKKTPDVSVNGIDNWFFIEDSLDSITTCGRVIVNASLLQISAYLNEFELLEKNMTNFKVFKGVETLYSSKIVTKGIMKVPLVADREIYQIAQAYVNNKEKMLCCLIKTPNKTIYPNFEEEKEDLPRIEMNFGFYFIRRLDEKRCEFFACFNSNPKIKLIPMKIINASVKEFIYDTMRDIKSIMEDPNKIKEYEQKIEEKKEVYDRVRKQIKNL